MAKLPIYMNSINLTTIEVKWWGVIYLRMKYYFSSFLLKFKQWQ